MMAYEKISEYGWKWYMRNDDVYFCTNNDGDGIFEVNPCRNSRHQLMGTMQFSIRGLKENSAKAKIRRWMNQ
nr:MAG TPA: hypothetical protein [Caudoviricetes sp.]